MPWHSFPLLTLQKSEQPQYWQQDILRTSFKGPMWSALPLHTTACQLTRLKVRTVKPTGGTIMLQLLALTLLLPCAPLTLLVHITYVR